MLADDLIALGRLVWSVIENWRACPLCITLRITGGRAGDGLWTAADAPTSAVDTSVDHPWSVWMARADCPRVSTPRGRSSRRCAEVIQECPASHGC